MASPNVSPISPSWARLAVEGPWPLRRGAWYHITHAAPNLVVLNVGGRPFSIPPSVVELAETRPYLWTVVKRPMNASNLLPEGWGDEYGVCPSCSHRAPLVRQQKRLGCVQCLSVFPVAWDESYLGRSV